MKANSAQTLKIDIRSFGYDASYADRERRSDGMLPVDGIDYKYMFESSYDAILLTDRDGVILSSNERAVDFFGYGDFDSLEGFALHSLIAGMTDAFMSEAAKTVDEGRYMRVQAFAKRLDGSFVAVEMIGRGTKSSQSDFLCFLIRDVQASKEAEQTLLSAYHAMDNTDSGIGIADLDGWISYANRKMLSMLGGGDDTKVIGQNLKVWFEDDTIVGPMTEAIAKGGRWTTEKQVAYRNAVRYIQISAVPDINEDGHTLGMVISIVDTTDRRRAEIAENTLEKEHLMMEALSEACHSIGQPATVLLTGIELLHDGRELDRESRMQVYDMCYNAVLELRECLKEINAARLSVKERSVE